MTNGKRLDVDAFTKAVGWFGLELEHDEDGSSANGEKVGFLGSVWKSGLPYRDVTKMSVASSVTRARLPMLPKLEDLVKGRFYTIFGYDCRVYELARQAGIDLRPGQRVFVLASGMGWEAQTKLVRSGVDGQ